MMALVEPTACSLTEQITWELLNLLNLLGIQKGELLVMEMKDVYVKAPSVLMDFAQDLFGSDGVRTEVQQIEEEEEKKEVQPHLVFMVWQATTLRQLTQWDYLDDTLCNMRNLFPCFPAVLVLVVVHPGPQEELARAVEALRKMQCLLDDAFKQVVVEGAVYAAGQPNGTLEVKTAACRALREVLLHQEGVSSLNPVSALIQTSPQLWVTDLCLSVCNVKYQMARE